MGAELTKLAVFDKDWTLVKPKSGGTFTRSPDDQELLSGVREKLEQMRSEGWCLAIASNQGGCAKFDCDVKKLKPGMLIWSPLADGQTMQDYKVLSIGEESAGMITLDLDKPRWNGKDYCYAPAAGKITASYKSIEDAIEEMRFAMDLTGISAGYFCPDMLGETMISCVIFDSIFRHMKLTTATALQTFGVEVDGFRKPQPGMLQYIKEMALFQTKTYLMVGDRPEDQQAAEAAGFEFEWAKDFFGGGNG